MERGEWENDPDYPRAPLPAHERTWRHPSEQGASQWVLSEPPLVVGRGLTLATGTIGVFLAVGLLWLMIPHNNRGGGGVAAQGSTTVRSTGVEPGSSRQSTPAAITNSPITTISSVVVSATTTTPMPAVTATTVGSGATDSSAAPTTRVERPTTTAAMIRQPAMAVALAPGHFVATTAASVGTESSVTVQLPSGEHVVGTVYSVDQTSGIAVISLPSGVDTSPMAPSQAQIPTDAAVVLTPQPSPVSVWRGDTGTQITTNPSIRLAEGALVLDADSHLIGLCTMAADGVHLVDAGSILAAINDAIASEAPVWLGVKVGADSDGNLTVLAVDADGPSALAGVQAGSVIRSLDGVAVTTLDALRRGLLVHKPGETARLSIVPPGATGPVDVTVTLTPNPGAL